MLLLIILALAAVGGFAIYKVYFPKVETAVKADVTAVEKTVSTVENTVKTDATAVETAVKTV